jgi:hypothetical protein
MVSGNDARPFWIAPEICCFLRVVAVSREAKPLVFAFWARRKQSKQSVPLCLSQALQVPELRIRPKNQHAFFALILKAFGQSKNLKERGNPLRPQSDNCKAIVLHVLKSQTMVNPRHFIFDVGGALTIACGPAFLVSLGFSGVAAVVGWILFAGDSASLCRDHGYPEDAERRGGERKLIGRLRQ